MFVRAEASLHELDGVTLTNKNDSTKSVKADGISGYAGAGISVSLVNHFKYKKNSLN